MSIITTRASKGAPLSWNEADANFTNLNTDKLEVSNNLSDVSNPTAAKSNLGLGNVENTSDINKPISAATQAGLDLKANATSPTTTGTLTHSGDIVLSGSGNRITGDFSNTTVANRLMFQTSTGTFTDIGALGPNAAQSAGWTAYLGDDPTNTSRTRMLATSIDARFESGITGTGTYLPMTFYTGGSERMRIATDGLATFNGLANFVSDINLSTGTDQYVYFDGALHLAKNGTGDSLVISTTGALGLSGANYGTAGQVLTSGGPSTAPIWSSVGSSAKAWCNFDGRTTGTNAPRAGSNVSSVTRNGAGDYTINFTSALANANYVASFSCPNRTDTTVAVVMEYSTDGSTPATKTTTSFRIVVRAASNNTGMDTGDINVIIFGG